MNRLREFPILTLCCIESRIENNQNFYGRFLLGPFEVGQGLTIANALRRTLLAELSGLAIVAVEIEGARHEYSTLFGIRESVLDILLNLKQIVLINRFQIQQPQIGYLQVQGPAIVKAGDLKLPLSVQCVDPEQHIATLSYDGFLNIKIIVCHGKKHLSFFDLSGTCEQPLLLKSSSIFKNTHLLPIDANFMAINKVNYSLETYRFFRFGKNKERVILEIWTNGSIHPRHAIHEAAKTLVRFFSPFQETKKFKSFFNNPLKVNFFKKDSVKKMFSLDIANLDLSLRPYTILKRAKINTIGDLINYSPEELLLLKNFGKRSLNEVQKLLHQIGFHLRKSIDNEHF